MISQRTCISRMAARYFCRISRVRSSALFTRARFATGTECSSSASSAMRGSCSMGSSASAPAAPEAWGMSGATATFGREASDAGGQSVEVWALQPVGRVAGQAGIDDSAMRVPFEGCFPSVEPETAASVMGWFSLFAFAGMARP